MTAVVAQLGSDGPIWSATVSSVLRFGGAEHCLFDRRSAGDVAAGGKWRAIRPAGRGQGVVLQALADTALTRSPAPRFGGAVAAALGTAALAGGLALAGSHLVR